MKYTIASIKYDQYHWNTTCFIEIWPVLFKLNNTIEMCQVQLECDKYLCNISILGTDYSQNLGYGDKDAFWSTAI